MVKSQSVQQALAQKLGRSALIGMHRDPRDKSRWIWVDGTRVIYSHWNQGQPDNAGGYESCGMMYQSGKWNDLQCQYPLHYVCETNGEGTLTISREISWHGMTKMTYVF